MSDNEIKLKCLELGIQRCADFKDSLVRDIDAESYALRYFNFIKSKETA